MILKWLNLFAARSIYLRTLVLMAVSNHDFTIDYCYPAVGVERNGYAGLGESIAAFVQTRLKSNMF
jgi:hypothetical protein